MKRLYIFLVGILLIVNQAFSQTISSGYTVGTWEGFRTSAATFTFDDACANQLSLAVPVFDTYGYKASFYLVTGWGPNWSTYSSLVTKGYEVGSHSDNHGNPMPDSEISTSKQTINSNITNQDCNTITYPNCAVPSETELAKYYIGGRICDGNINPKSPSNYYRIGSIICGSQGSCNTVDNFKTQLNSAINSQGWAVFLIHEVESGSGYSPTATSAIEGALQYASDNDSKIWVTTFRNAIMYAKERDNLSLVETTVSSTELSLTTSTSLSNSVVTYNYPITVRREIPSGWTNVAVALNSTDIPVTIETVNSVKYAQFSVVPGNTYTLEDRESTATVEGGSTTTTTTNSLSNGEFDEGTASWNVQNNSSTASTFSISTSAGMSGSNAAQICPDASNYGTAGWHIQLYQNVTLEAGKQYTLTFSAKAASARTMGLMIQQLADPYTSYLATSYNLTTTAQTFTEIFTAPSDVDAASKITFCVGGDPNCVYIDNVFFGTESTSGGGSGGTGGDVEVTGDISQYFIDKAYIGPSCDGTPNERGAYYTGEYPNLFTQYLGKTQAEVDAKINSVWNHFFSGTNTVYYEVGTDMAYIYDIGNGDVRTEGMSYGMMVCVQLGKQTQFDRLWRWAKKYMQYKSGDSREGLFAWQCETNGTIKGASCAPDGEAYFLTALFFASHRWGNDGSINYEEEAQYLIKEILDKPGRAAGTVSPIFNMSNYLITFGETSYGFTDPSYNLPGFFELWARWTNTNKTFWEATPAAARDLLYKSAHTTTGLFPDYCQFDGTPYKPSWCGYESDYYKYDAIRCPMNVGMDYNWFAADSRQQTMTKNILTFFKNDGYQHGYFTVSGGSPSGDYSEGMAGANGVGVFALASGNDALAKEYVQKLWNTNPPSGTWRYYNGMVYLLSMLHASGDFKIFKPTPDVVTQTLSGPAPVEFNGESFSKDTAFKTLIDCKIYDVTITIEETSSHTVIFKDYDGTQLSTAEVADGENATAPTEPSRTGYTFTGWDKAYTNVTADLTVTAVYTIKSYTVTFLDYNGTQLASQTIEHGSAATAPTSPSRTGYTFAGWDTDFSNVTSSLTVTATYDVVYTTTRYEAENAAGSGTSTVSLAGTSNGKYVQMQDGSITFTVNALDGAGTYKINIRFSQTYGDSKTQNVQVNGASAGSVSFVKTGSNVTFSSVEVVLSLNSGSNTIAITKSWGWVDIDYIEVTKNQIEKFTIDENLVTPNPANGAQEMYDFLRENFGSNVVSGVMTLDVMDASSQTYDLINQTEVAYIYSASGKYPALVGFDFMHSTGLNSTNAWQKAYTNSAIAMAKELWNSGGIPQFTWHWRNPNQNDDSFYTSGTSFNLANAFTNSSYTTWNTSSTEYKNIIADIDIIAGYLEQLRCDGVSILWRPIHEASGAWFWWGAKGSTAYKQLYQLMFDRLVNYHGLNNLIWVWNSDGTDSDWYPGANYVDIVGRDYYYSPREINHASLVSEYVAVAEVTNYNKIVSLAECGSVPYPTNMLNDGAKWSYFMPWYGDYVTSDNTTSDWNTIMNNDIVISLDEMTGWDGRTKLFDTVSLGNSYTENGFSVTPAIVGDSENELTLSDQKGCDSVVVLFLHTKAAEIVTYTVTFIDGYTITTIETQTIESGQSATAPTVPVHENYTFSGWDKTFTNVTSNLTVTAQYTENAKADYSALNAAIAEAEALIETDYTSTTWSAMQTALAAANAVDKNLYVEDQSTVDAATTALTDAVNALVKVFTVTFVDYNGTTIQTVKVESGQSATAPTVPVHENYTFSGWDKTFTNVTSNLTVTAQYIENAKADYSALNAAIAEAEALTETDYTSTTWSAMQTALAAANAVDKNLYVEDQSTVDAATTALTDAVNALVKVFTVTFVDYNGTTIQTVKVESGQSATAPTDPTRDGYTFSGWDKTFTNVTSNLTVTAQYIENAKADYSALNAAIVEAEALIETDYTATTWSAMQTALTSANAVDKNLYIESQSTVDAATTALTDAMNALVKVYTVTFVDYNGTTIQTVKVESGQSATAPTEPTRDGYTFSGWDKTFTSVTSNLIVTAQYIENAKADYSALNAAIAEAEALIETDYTSTTWSAMQTALTAANAVDKYLYAESQSTVDAATTALTDAMNALVKVYTVTFVDYNGTELKSETVEIGNGATAPTEPTRDGYTFSGWDKTFTSVTSNLIVTAQYVENGKADYNALNSAITEAEALIETDYTATTWSAMQTALTSANAVDKNLYVENQSTVDAATTELTDAVNALVKVFTVTFVDYNGTTIQTVKVESGQSAIAPTEPTRDGYTFSGWDKTFTNVTSNLTVTAQYTENAKADYSALNAAIAEAEALTETDYTATTWSAMQTALAAANAVDKNLYVEDQSTVDAATTALTGAMNALVNVYTVTFVDYNGTELKSETVESGNGATAPTDPTRDGYTFSGWDKTFTNVTSDLTITAQYTQKAKADYIALNAAIAQAGTLAENIYTSDSWSVMQNALTAANAVDKNLYAESQSMVDAATTALTNAISNLVNVNRTILASTISTAESTVAAASIGNNKGQYPIDAKTALNDAIQSAKTVYNKVSVSQSEIGAANSALIDAIDAFNASIITVDKNELLIALGQAHTAIARADGNTGSGSGQYPEIAVTTLQAAIDNAQQIYNTAREQLVVDAETNTLLSAIQAFLQSVNPIVIDYSELDALVTEASNLIETTTPGENPGQYSLLAYMDLWLAKQTAEEIVANQSASTQEDVDLQETIMREAIDAYRNSIILAAQSVDPEAVSIYSKGYNVVVENAENQGIMVYDITGRVIATVAGSEVSDYTEIQLTKCGVYIVKCDTAIARVLIQ